MVEKMTDFINRLNGLMGVTARVVWDAAGRDIARTEIHIDQAVSGISAEEVILALKKGAIAIYFRGYRVSEGFIEVDVRSLSAEQLQTIYMCINAVLSGEKNA